MPTFTLKDPKKMGDNDPKYGQSYWAYTHESQLPVKFNLMEGSVSDGQKITCEEAATKTSSKGTDYQQLRKVKPVGSDPLYEDNTTFAKPAYQPREDHHEAIKAQWAIGQAVQVFISEKGKSLDQVEIDAKEFYGMVERVKSSEPKTGYNTFKQAGEAVKAKQDTPVSNEEVDSLINSGEEISLADIPF
jgi:hypothetical protein